MSFTTPVASRSDEPELGKLIILKKQEEDDESESPDSGPSPPIRMGSIVAKLLDDPKEEPCESEISYLAKRGDTLEGISIRYQTSKASIRTLNRLTGGTVFPGQRLRIRPKDESLQREMNLKQIYRLDDINRSSLTSPEASMSPPMKSRDHLTSEPMIELEPIPDTVVRTLSFPFECPFMTEAMALDICDQLPPTLLSRRWILLYHLEDHGASLMTLTERISLHGPTLIAILNDRNEVFGGFASVSWKKMATYYGNGQSFLFRYDTMNNCILTYKWSKLNSLFQYLTDDSIAMGGGGNCFGFCLDSGLLHVTSGACLTYKNDPLTSVPVTRCCKLMVWGFDSY